MHVRFPPELQQQCHASLRVDQGIRGFPSRLSHESFPRGFPTGLPHVPPWCESILGLKVEAVQGKQISLEWTETHGGPWEWWHDPGVPLVFRVESAPLEMRRERREFLAENAGKGSLLSSLEAETGLLWMWAGLSCFLSSGDGMSGKFLSCSKGVNDPLEVPEVSCD